MAEDLTTGHFSLPTGHLSSLPPTANTNSLGIFGYEPCLVSIEGKKYTYDSLHEVKTEELNELKTVIAKQLKNPPAMDIHVVFHIAVYNFINNIIIERKINEH